MTIARDVTLVEILGELAHAGYTGDFVVDADGAVCCRVCGTCQPAAELELDGQRRVEGASDPGDMAVVLALRCGTCNQRGSAIVRYGPEASEGDAALLRHLDQQVPQHLDVAEAAASDPREEPAEGSPDEEQSDEGGDSDVEPDPARSGT
jgi:hypothetical protein